MSPGFMCAFWGALIALSAVAPAAERTHVLYEWRFDQAAGWNGWSPNSQIDGVSFASDHVRFQTNGPDPQLTSPIFALAPAAQDQSIELDFECKGDGRGEVFFTNTTAGPYGGFQQAWSVQFQVADSKRRIIPVWPFWQKAGQIIRLRLDPPCAGECRLYAVRVVASLDPVGAPEWDFRGSAATWRSMGGASLHATPSGLTAAAETADALMISAVEPFAATACSLLTLNARCAGERTLSLYWITREESGLHGVPLPLDADGRASLQDFDMRCFPTWRGTVTHLALGFGSRSGERLTVRRLALKPADTARPFARLRHLNFAHGINRPARPARLRVIVENAGDVALPASTARLTAPLAASIDIPALAPNQCYEGAVAWTPRRAGKTVARLEYNDQVFERVLRVDPPLPPVAPAADGYPVPPPQPVVSRYQLGVYYFPGWSPDQWHRWNLQAGYPERDPVLGWYEEGSPEVADWHIKWAVENGLSFFIYDWYWRDGKEDLRAGLNEGFFNARYRDCIQFALMWANHPPFADHTPAQLAQVVDYWLEHYLRRSNYLRVDGLPYVSFFSPYELLAAFGDEARVRERLDAMRARVRAAGLPGLHIAACGGLARSAAEQFQRMGFDSFTAYNYVGIGAAAPQASHRRYMHAHREIWERLEGAALPYVPLLTVNWDARPWHGPRTTHYFARSTETFAEGLRALRRHLDTHGKTMAILEAWNEWGEGSYLEPNVEFGFADLEAVRAVFAARTAWPRNVAPVDTGVEDRYDLRLRSPFRQGMATICR